MGSREPITADLRRALDVDREFIRADGAVVAQTLYVGRDDFDRLCDAIDAVHAGLERENAELRERLAVLDNRSESMHIGEATVTITPALDWTGVARELQAIAATLGAGTCHDLGGTGANDEQVFNCSECGCVLSLYDSDGTNTLCTHFIYDYPRYCPECGRKVVNDG